MVRHSWVVESWLFVRGDGTLLTTYSGLTPGKDYHSFWFSELRLGRPEMQLETETPRTKGSWRRPTPTPPATTAATQTCHISLVYPGTADAALIVTDPHYVDRGSDAISHGLGAVLARHIASLP